jgi:hypothetical protein
VARAPTQGREDPDDRLRPTRAWSKGVIPTPSCGWGQAEDAVAKAPSTSSPPTGDGVDKLYHKLAEIHAITAMQLVECVRWHHSESSGRH